MTETTAPDALFDTLPHEEQLKLLAELSRSALTKYALPAGCSVDLLNLSENATYKVEGGGSRWALRVHRDGYHSPTAIRCLKAALNADCDGQAGLQELAGNATMLFYMSQEAQEGRDAFKQKRKPDFSKFPRQP